MKLKYFLAIAGFAMAISSCDEGTDNIGMSLISSNDDEAVNRYLVQVMNSGVVVTGFTKEENSLESLFMQLTGDREENANQSDH